jgi:hypothetical protein
VGQYWIYALALAAIIQIYQFAVDVAEHRLIDAYIISKALPRALFVLVLLPIYFNMDWFALPEGDNAYFTLFRIAATFSGFIIVFALLRQKADNRAHNAVKMWGFTLLCVPVFMLYSFALQLVWTHFSIIFIGGVLPLLILVYMLVMIVGENLPHPYKVIGNSACRWCDKDFPGLYDYCCTEHKNTADEIIKNANCSRCKTTGLTGTRQEAKDGSILCGACRSTTFSGSDGYLYTSDPNGSFIVNGTRSRRL